MLVISIFHALIYAHLTLAFPQDLTVSSSLSVTSTSLSSSAVSSSQTSLSTSTTSTSTTAIATCTGNAATDRSTWCDYDISTNYYDESPDTGVVREYWLELTETIAAPDGVERFVMLVNGSLPGPTLEGNWGDTFKIHVTNNLSVNGTSIHFHGIRQNYTNQNDGVSSITQCPTPPGSSYTYTWKATQYGTSWYHSHFALQAWEGVFGGIVIHGPASGNYDEDLGVIFLNDWSHQTVDELWITTQTNGPPTLDNGLINGTNTYDDAGSRFEVSVSSDTSYRLRLINGAIDTHFKFMIDNHTMTVIASDFVPIVPYETTVLDITMGQRYDVIVNMNQSDIASDFWLRAIPQAACSDNDNSDDIKGIIHYDDSDTEPTTSGYDYTDECVDEDSSNLVPYVSLEADSSSWSSDEDVTVGFNSDNLFRWYLSDVTMVAEWDNPTLLQVYSNTSDWTTSSHTYELSTANEWAYVVIESTLSIPHPIHLHGHDFFVLGSGSGVYNSSVSLQMSNPPRRDVATMQAGGYLVLGFYTDNPGAWLMHCHIGWHTGEGFDLQFVERYDEISDLLDADVLTDTCDAWTTYAEEADIEQDDSGV